MPVVNNLFESILQCVSRYPATRIVTTIIRTHCMHSVHKMYAYCYRRNVRFVCLSMSLSVGHVHEPYKNG